VSSILQHYSKLLQSFQNSIIFYLNYVIPIRTEAGVAFWVKSQGYELEGPVFQSRHW